MSNFLEEQKSHTNIVKVHVPNSLSEDALREEGCP
jgi:hypothetical protein